MGTTFAMYAEAPPSTVPKQVVAAIAGALAVLALVAVVHEGATNADKAYEATTALDGAPRFGSVLPPWKVEPDGELTADFLNGLDSGFMTRRCCGIMNE